MNLANGPQFPSPKIFEQNRKTARCFPTSYTVNRVITAISRFFVTPVKPISFRPSIGSGAGAMSRQSSELSSGSADGGVFGCVWELSQRSKGCRLVQDAGVVMVGVGVWVEKIEKKQLEVWQTGQFFLDVDNFQVLFGTFLSALGRSFLLQKGSIH